MSLTDGSGQRGPSRQSCLVSALPQVWALLLTQKFHSFSWVFLAPCTGPAWATHAFLLRISDVLPPRAKVPHGLSTRAKGKGQWWTALGNFFQWDGNHFAHLTAIKSKNVNVMFGIPQIKDFNIAVNLLSLIGCKPDEHCCLQITTTGRVDDLTTTSECHLHS